MRQLKEKQKQLVKQRFNQFLFKMAEEKTNGNTKQKNLLLLDQHFQHQHAIQKITGTDANCLVTPAARFKATSNTDLFRSDLP